MKQLKTYIVLTMICGTLLYAIGCSSKKDSVDTPPTPGDCKTGLTAGVNFTAVKSIISNNCTRCHSGASPTGGVNFTDDCTIVSKAARIKARAVDGIPSFMPPDGTQLPQADKDKITAWVNAGGKYNN